MNIEELKKIVRGNGFQESHGSTTIVIDVETVVDLLDELKQCDIPVVVSSCVNQDTLIEDLNDKRIVGKTIDENMWHYCRKETAQHLLDKYEIRPK